VISYKTKTENKTTGNTKSMPAKEGMPSTGNISPEEGMLSGDEKKEIGVKVELPHLAKFLRDNLTEKEIVELKKVDSQISDVFTEVNEGISNNTKKVDLTKFISNAKKDLDIFADQLKQFFNKDKISEFNKF
jgi:hypothetical protein